MIDYELKNIPRTWTREEYKRASRWLRLVQNHMNKLDLNTILYNLIAGNI